MLFGVLLSGNPLLRDRCQGGTAGHLVASAKDGHSEAVPGDDAAQCGAKGARTEDTDLKLFQSLSQKHWKTLKSIEKVSLFRLLLVLLIRNASCNAHETQSEPLSWHAGPWLRNATDVSWKCLRWRCSVLDQAICTLPPGILWPGHSRDLGPTKRYEAETEIGTTLSNSTFTVQWLSLASSSLKCRAERHSQWSRDSS